MSALIRTTRTRTLSRLHLTLPSSTLTLPKRTITNLNPKLDFDQSLISSDRPDDTFSAPNYASLDGTAAPLSHDSSIGGMLVCKQRTSMSEPHQHQHQLRSTIFSSSQRRTLHSSPPPHHQTKTTLDGEAEEYIDFDKPHRHAKSPDTHVNPTSTDYDQAWDEPVLVARLRPGEGRLRIGAWGASGRREFHTTRVVRGDEVLNFDSPLVNHQLPEGTVATITEADDFHAASPSVPSSAASSDGVSAKIPSGRRGFHTTRVVRSEMGDEVLDFDSPLVNHQLPEGSVSTITESEEGFPELTRFAPRVSA
ncbi:hypothetical protein YB2330_001753 [Saitoella coloradoensis]